MSDAFDAAGIFGSMSAVRAAIDEFSPRRIVFGTDYPMEILSTQHLSEFVRNIRALGDDGGAILAGNAGDLVNLN